MIQLPNPAGMAPDGSIDFGVFLLRTFLQHVHAQHPPDEEESDNGTRNVD